MVRQPKSQWLCSQDDNVIHRVTQICLTTEDTIVILLQQADMLLPLPTLIGIEIVLFALVEYKRYEGFKKTGKVIQRPHLLYNAALFAGLVAACQQAPAVPFAAVQGHTTTHRTSALRLQSGFLGSFPFDPVGLDSPANAEKEIKNGRLGANLTLPLLGRGLASCQHEPCMYNKTRAHPIVPDRRWRMQLTGRFHNSTPSSMTLHVVQPCWRLWASPQCTPTAA